MKQDQNRLGDFMEGKGYYIVLLLCIAAIGVSTFFLFRSLTNPEVSTAGHMSVVEEPEETPVVLPQQIETADPVPSSEVSKETAEPAPEAAAVDPPNEKAANANAFLWPVQGEVSRDFSLEVFAYDDTMGDWRTHNGLDIAAELGAPVSACAKGTVTEIRDDPLMGKTVVIEHKSGYASVYSNLNASLNVQEGTEVEAGSVIGTVGTTAAAESAAEPHLHFELQECGVSVDPTYYLP